MKKFKKLLVCMLAVMMLISSAIPVSAAARPAIPTIKNAEVTSTGRMYLSWKTVSNADGYKLRIYNCNTKKSIIPQKRMPILLILYLYGVTDG